MHEWAMSDSILNSAIDIAHAQGILRITKIRIGVGELRQIDSEILRFALESLKAGSEAGTATLEIELIPARFSCSLCDNGWEFSQVKAELISDMGSDNPMHYVPDFIFSFMQCPRCHSPDFKIISGREMTLSVEGEK